MHILEVKLKTKYNFGRRIVLDPGLTMWVEFCEIWGVGVELGKIFQRRKKITEV